MSASKRTDIQEAALHLFAEQGVDGTSIRQIADRAGTAEGNIYRHFSGKDELVGAIFEECARRFHAVLRRESDESSDPRKRLKGLIAGIFVFAAEHPTEFDYLISIHRHVLGRIDTTSEPLPLRLFTAAIQDGIDRGLFRSVDPTLAAGWFVGMSQRAISLREAGLVPTDRVLMVEETFDAAGRILEPNEG
jgi:AcrR family transcriptional regulator